MKKVNLLVFGLIMAAGLSSCMKEREVFDHEAQYQKEKPEIEAYVVENLPGATFEEKTGIWYQILQNGEPGSYEYKIVNNQIEAPVITVKYTGLLLNGTKFDENVTDAGAQLSLGNVIAAWQIAFLPNKIDGEEIGGLTTVGLQKGARIRFVTPSRWAYREIGQGKIPANAPLDFEIEVLNIVPPGGSN